MINDHTVALLLWVNPLSEKSWEKALVRLLKDGGLANRVKGRAIARLLWGKQVVLKWRFLSLAL